MWTLTEEVLRAVVVIVIVLWEVIDPEAVPFVDPWKGTRGKGRGRCARGSFILPLTPDRVTARVPGPGQALGTEREERLRRRRGKVPMGSLVTAVLHSRTFHPFTVKGHTINNYSGTRDLQRSRPGQAGYAVPNPRGQQSHV